MYIDAYVTESVSPSHKWGIREDHLLYFVIFLVLPFVDLLNGYLVLNHIIPEAGLASPSQFGRAFTLVLFAYMYRKGGLPSWIFILFSYLLLVELVAALASESVYALLFGMVSISKIVYLVLLATLISRYLQTKHDLQVLSRYLRANLWLISTVLFISLVFGLGKSTYGSGFGTKGYFSSGNGLGVYLGVMTTFLIAANRYGYLKTRVLTLLCFVSATMVVGSKAVLLISFVNLILLCFSMKNRLLIFIVAVAFLVININNIAYIAEIVYGVIWRRYQAADRLLDFLGSGRTEYVSHAWNVFVHQDYWGFRIITGLGGLVSYQDPLKSFAYFTLEADIFDLLFIYGVVAVVVYLFAFMRAIYLLRGVFVMAAGLAMLFLHSMLAGHVIFDGMSEHAVAIYLGGAVFLRRNISTVARV
ncbi:MAG: hypothetical protein ABUS47_15975 [Steroidobacter sp.]